MSVQDEANHNPYIDPDLKALRVRAEASGMYAGIDAPTYLTDDQGLYCIVTVYRHVPGLYPRPFSASGYLHEHADPDDDHWNEMPRYALARLIEALALENAFPSEADPLSALPREEKPKPAAPRAPGAPRTPGIYKDLPPTTHITAVYNTIPEDLRPPWNNFKAYASAQPEKALAHLEVIARNNNIDLQRKCI